MTPAIRERLGELAAKATPLQGRNIAALEPHEFEDLHAFQSAANPGTILELLDRLTVVEEALGDVVEWAENGGLTEMECRWCLVLRGSSPAHHDGCLIGGARAVITEGAAE